MKARIILITTLATFFLSSCTQCDCEKNRNKDGRYGNEQTDNGTSGDQNADGTGDRADNDQNGSGTGGNGGNAGTSTRSGSNGYTDKNASGSERTTVHGGDGVGNANTERGVNTFDTDGAPPASTTTQPRKPGTTGSYRTRASGTGTQSGRQVN